MIQLVPVALYGWILLGPLLFWLLKPRTATLILAIGGYLVLPVAMFDPAKDTGIVDGVWSLPHWIMPNALPSQYWLTKATAVGLSLLLGLIVWDPKAVTRVCWKPWDMMLVAWCLWPIVTGVARQMEPVNVALMTAYQCLAWGVPYMIGRVYFSDAPSLEALADAFLIGGLLNLPISLVECFTGPAVYGWVYGFHPFARDGVDRYVGNRPLGFFELGNQSGVYLASVALLAVWLATHGRKRRVLGIPLRIVAILLVIQALLAQGVGAIGLSLAVLTLLFVMQRLKKIWPAVAVGILIAVPLIVAAGLVLTGRVNMAAAVRDSRVGAAVAGWLDGAGRHSLAWRLNRDVIHLPAAIQHPLTGNGSWDWWDRPDLPDHDRGPRARPWDLPMLVLGMFGLGGVLCWAGVMLMPVFLAASVVHPRFWLLDVAATPVALCAVLIVMVLDTLQNSPLFLPVLLASGGLAHVRMATPREVT